MTNDIRVLFVDPLSDAGVSPDHLSDAVTDLTVVPADTVDDVLGTLSETRIDCVLSGYSLPDTDGIELVNVVRQTRPDLPFILCTESGSEHVASRAISAGVSDYFRTRETDADTLAKRIEQTIRPSSSNEPDRRFDHYQSIVQAMGDGVYTLDTNGRMTAVNDTRGNFWIRPGGTHRRAHFRSTGRRGCRAGKSSHQGAACGR
ncbi:response regulator [Haladaptatus sp. R4]|uniref:response regulator n=1 Tax=Haladaptatus sp. R4 TaxID=1679489 RepID=UPI001CBDA9DA|nr:response regulator [Haladaptatus sp. R4]